MKELLLWMKNVKNWYDRIFSTKKIHITYNLRDGSKVTIRVGSWDTKPMTEVMFKDCYGLKDIKLPINPVIIDGGAHIGTFTIHAYNTFRSPKIFVIEPDKHNLKMLRKNINNNGLQEDVIVIPKALWKDNNEISVGWFKKKQSKVKCTTLASLMKEYNIDKVDLLKLDIEGSEYEVLRHAKTLFDKINVIVLEYHVHDKKTYNDLCEILGDAYVVRHLSRAERIIIATRKKTNKT